MCSRRMAVFYSWLVICFCTWITVVSASDSDTNGIEVRDFEELRSMYTRLLRENRKMKRQIGRINVIYKGLRAMCNTIDLTVANDKLEEQWDKQEKKDNEDGQIMTEQEGSKWIEVIGITSSGDNDSTSVTVTFKATDMLDDQWILQYTNGEILQQHGELRSKGNIYDITLKVTDFPNLTRITLWARSMSESRTLAVEMRPDTFAETFNADDLYSPMIHAKLDQSYQMTEGQTLTIDVPVLVDGGFANTSVLDQLEAHLSCEYFYVNTTKQPYTMDIIASYSKYDSALISVYLHEREHNETAETDTDSNMRLIVTLSHELSEYGGLLHVVIRTRTTTHNIKYKYLKVMHILPPGGKSSIPKNSMAIYRRDEAFVNEGPSSVSFLIVGNPPPKVKAFKKRNKGRSQKRVDTEEFRFGFLVIHVINFVNQTRSDIRGTYTFRAANGFDTIESNTTVDLLQIVKIQKALVKKNTSEEIVVTCKATGRPRPSMKFEDSTKEDFSNRYQVTEETLGRYGKRIEMTVPNNDTTPSLVGCYAWQDNYYSSDNKHIALGDVHGEDDDWATYYNSTYYRGN